VQGGGGCSQTVVVRKDSENWQWKVWEEIGSTRVAEEASSESIERDPTREGKGWRMSGTSGVRIQGKTGGTLG